MNRKLCFMEYVTSLGKSNPDLTDVGPVLSSLDLVLCGPHEKKDVKSSFFCCMFTNRIKVSDVLNCA